MSSSVTPTIFHSATAARPNVDASSGVGAFTVRAAYSSDLRAPKSIRPISEQASNSATSTDNKFKGFTVKRRLKGFIVDTEGETWRVMFVDGGKRIPYNLPAKQLRDVGVTTPNQPFEMDEMVPRQAGVSGKIYRFKAMAKASDAFQDILSLDSEQQQKRAFILSKLAKLKG